jgi:hypothetical protein
VPKLPSFLSFNFLVLGNRKLNPVEDGMKSVTSNLARSFRRLFLVCAALATLSSMALAQEATGRVSGTVYDTSGAVVPDVHIVVTNTSTHIARGTTTDKNGFYQVLSLAIGDYTVSADHKGFIPVTTSASTLEINQTLKIDIKLQVGAETQIVTVESAAAAIETVNPTLGSTVSGVEIGNAPLNGRNALDLALLQPGVLPADNPGNAGARSANTAFSISGGRNDSNTFLLDGGLNNDLLDNGVVYNPNPDSIEEFRVLTNNFTAEYGRNGGGIVTVVTKSGTNDWHGSGFEFNRNEAYNANDFIDNSLGKPRAILKRNQYGVTFGGPIKKNKLFFFLSYQGQRESQSNPTDVGTAFTPAELNGDFSQSSHQTKAAVACFLSGQQQPGGTPAGELENPCQVATAPLTPNSFFQPDPTLAAQGVIKPSQIDPVALAYIKAGFIPSNASGVAQFQVPGKDDRDEITGKFDLHATEKDQLAITLGRAQNPNSGLPGTVGFPGFAGAPALSLFATGGNSHRYFLNFAYTRIVSSSMLNEFRVTAQRRNNLQANPSTKLGTPQSFGTTVTPDNATAPPLLTFPSLTAGLSPQGPSTLIDNTFGYTDTFTWTRGKHTMKFGGGFSAFQDNQVFDFFVNGNFDFVPSVGNVDSGTNLQTTFGAGDPFANFLLGIPDFFFQAPAAPSNIRGKTTHTFAQDEWHVANNLVLTAGLRYEYSTPKSDTKGRTFSIVPGAQSTVFPNAPVGVLFPGDKGAPTGANFPRKNDFAPRFGFAWQPFHDSKTSIRGGFGLFYDILKAEDNFQFNGQFPFAATSTIFFSDPSGTTAPFGFATDPFGSTGSPNPFPSKPVDHNISFINNVGTFGGNGVFFVDPNIRTPYTYQYNLSVEHELARKLTVAAAYVGSSSHGLTGLKDINPFDPATLSNPNPQRILNETPGNFPAFTNPDPNGVKPAGFNPNLPNGSLSFLPEFRNVANANYHALQLSARQQSTTVPVLGNMYYTFAYTYAHSIDDASGFRNNQSQVPFFQPHLFRGSSDFDLRHVITFSGGWDLPFNHGPQKLVKGWSLYPIVSWRTGYPIDVTPLQNAQSVAPGVSGVGDQNLLNANLIKPIQYLDPHKEQTINGVTGFFFFSPNSYGPATKGYGTSPRDLLRGPGRTNVDLSLAKDTPLHGDRFRFKATLDAFNVFNHTQFRALGNNSASTKLGEAVNTYSPRILQLGAHITF